MPRLTVLRSPDSRAVPAVRDALCPAAPPTPFGLGIAVVIAAALVVGCAREAPVRPLLDLTAVADEAIVHVPTTRIDFSSATVSSATVSSATVSSATVSSATVSSATVWSHLVDGWQRDQHQLGSGRIGVWSLGDTSSLEIFVARPRDLALDLEVLTPQALDGPDARLGVAIGGQPLEPIALSTTKSRYSLEIPAALLRPGLNTIQFRNPPGPPRGARKDIRLIWLDLRLRAPTAPARWVRPDAQAEARATAQAAQKPAPRRPRVSNDGEMLFVPVGSRLDFYLELPARTELVVDAVRARNTDGALEVSFTPAFATADVASGDALPETPLEPVTVRLESGATIELTGDAPRSGRLSFFARPADSRTEPVADSTFVLAKPRLVERLVGGMPADDVSKGGQSTGGQSTDDAAANAPNSSSAPRPNIIVYLVDTLRADHLSTYGYDRPTSPCLDRFATEATVFERGQAQSPWTRSSVASMLTGLLPQQHRVLDDQDALADDAISLAERLREAGYATAAVTANGNASALAGFHQGFDSFDYLRWLTPEEPLADSMDVHRTVEHILDRVPGEHPLFLWVHTIDPHLPYHPPEPFLDRFAPGVDPALGSTESILALEVSVEPPPEQTLEGLRALYDGTIAANDAAFCALLDELRAHERYDDSLIVFLSDHGEEFFDHGGWTHGKTLFAEMLDTPFVVRLPGQSRGQRIDAVTEHVDLLPTILDLLALASERELPGDSLLPLLRDPSTPWRQRAVAHLELRGRSSMSLLDDRWKLIRYWRGDDTFAPDLFDVESDPHETTDLAVRHRELAHVLERRAQGIAEDALPLLERTEVDKAKMKAAEAELRALGYVE